jgi:hypothetical protein
MIGVFASVILPFTLVAMICYFNFDPFWFILPQIENLIVNRIVLLMRICGLALATYVGWLSMAIFLMAGIVQLKMYTETTNCLSNWAEFYPKALSSNSSAAFIINVAPRLTNSWKSSFGKIMLPISKVLSIQRQARILIKLTNDTQFLTVPCLLLFGQSILVLTNYATIRMQDRIPMPFYFGMPCISLFVILIMLTLFPLASGIHEASTHFLLISKSIVGRNKYWRKVWRAERPLSIHIRPFFPATKAVKSAYFFKCFELTANALLIT